MTNLSFADSERYIAYVGPFNFPGGGAAARRILGNSLALMEAGFSVKVACGQTDYNHAISYFQGIEVHSLGERSAEHLPRWVKRLAYTGIGGKTIAWLDSQKVKPFAVVLYSGYSPYLLRLIPWARRNEVRLIFDAVEWYQPDSIIDYLSPYQLNIEFAMQVLLPRVPNIISISRYLHDHYAIRGAKSIIVPPLLDVAQAHHSELGREPTRLLKLVYAGSPGKKDLLDNILHAVLQLSQQGLSLRLTVAGIPSSSSSYYSSLKLFPSSLVSQAIEFAGVLSHSASMDLVRDADFSVLLRNVARYSKAGFPTKFVESLSVGTPVIANLTSDLDQYLLDGITGFRCQGPMVKDLKAGLIRAAKISVESHTEMRRACRALALQAFDHRIFSNSLSNFFLSARI